MRRTELTTVVFAAAMAVFSLLYVFPPPAPRYYPMEGVWRIFNDPDGVSMGWYGQFAVAFLGGGLAGAMSALLIRAVGCERSLKPMIVAFVSVMSLLCLVFAMAAIVARELAA